MSASSRLADARLLWEQGRKEGAFLSLLVALAATARRRFPDFKDREAFERFIASSYPMILSVEYRGHVEPVEHILYKWFRCELVHEGGLPFDIAIMKDTEPHVLSVRAGGGPKFVLKLSESWFWHLFAAVDKAPENAS